MWIVMLTLITVKAVRKMMAYSVVKMILKMLKSKETVWAKKKLIQIKDQWKEAGRKLTQTYLAMKSLLAQMEELKKILMSMEKSTALKRKKRHPRRSKKDRKKTKILWQTSLPMTILLKC